VSSTYVGDPTASQSPGAQPNFGVYPQASLPADGDPLVAASVAQMAREAMDYIAFIQQMLGGNFIQEPWNYSLSNVTATANPLTNAEHWHLVATSSRMDVFGSNVNFNAGFMELTTAATSAVASMTTPSQLIFPGTGRHVNMKWQAGHNGASFPTSTAHQSVMGFMDNASSPGASANYAWFEANTVTSGSANWVAKCAASSTATSVGTGVAVGTADTYPTQTFQIVFNGITSIQYYINSNLVTTITTNIPATGMYSGFAMVSGSYASTVKLDIGPMLMTWNG